MFFATKFLIFLLRFWVKTGIAPGYCYQLINSFSFQCLGTVEIIDGVIIDCDLDDHVQKQIFFFGCYEPIETNFLRNRVNESDLIFDIGANIGQYSLILGKKLLNGLVCAFEANSETFKLLEKNIMASGLEDKIISTEMALWSEVATLEFIMPEEKNIGGFGVIDKNNLNHKSSVKVSAQTLDSWFEKRSDYGVDSSLIPQLIKIDVEGAELNVLKGARKLLEEFAPDILLEVCVETASRQGYHVSDLWSYLKKFGYQAYGISNSSKNFKKIVNFEEIKQENIFLTIESSENINSWLNKNHYEYSSVKNLFYREVKVISLKKKG